MTQSNKWHETRKARMDELFKGKRFEIVEEFKNEEPQETPLGYKVKSGYRVKLVQGSPNEAAEFVVGKALLNQMADDYSAIDKPEPRRRGRPKKSPATIEQAEQWASRDIPNDAQQITQPGPVYGNPNADEKA